MTEATITPSPLVYNGEVINHREEMLSLTDMWRAAGRDPQQTPAKWRELPSAKIFVEHIEITIGKSDSDLFLTKNGGSSPGTWAHWQIGLAYAKYLSPDFHMWCNEVVRERMTGRSETPCALFGGTREIRRSFVDFHVIARTAGFVGNEATLAANRATVKVTGFDPLALMGTTHLIASKQEEHLTPTIIGQRLDGLSAQSVNKRLEALGYQNGSTDGHGNKAWYPTEKGEPFGVWLDTSKKHNDGTSIRQWKWYASIIDEMRTGAVVAVLETA